MSRSSRRPRSPGVNRPLRRRGHGRRGRSGHPIPHSSARFTASVGTILGTTSFAIGAAASRLVVWRRGVGARWPSPGMSASSRKRVEEDPPINRWLRSGRRAWKSPNPMGSPGARDRPRPPPDLVGIVLSRDLFFTDKVKGTAEVLGFRMLAGGRAVAGPAADREMAAGVWSSST